MESCLLCLLMLRRGGLEHADLRNPELEGLQTLQRMGKCSVMCHDFHKAFSYDVDVKERCEAVQAKSRVPLEA